MNKKLIVLLAILLWLPMPVLPQSHTFGIVFGAGQPANPCPNGELYVQTDLPGTMWACNAGTWVLSSGTSVSNPGLVVTPASISFGTVQTTTTSPVQHITISNTGNTTISNIVVSLTGNADFSSTSLSVCNGSLLSGASCVVPFQFTPTAASAETATVTVASSFPDAAPTVALSGTGTAAASFPLVINGSGSGTVSSDDGLILCTLSLGVPSGACSASYASGATPTLTAIPSPNFIFSSFAGGGCSVSPCTISVSAATTVSATFAASAPSVLLNVTGSGPGTGTITSDLSALGGSGILNCLSTAGVTSSAGNSGCSGNFNQGAIVTLTAAAGLNSTFAGWSAPCSGTGTCVVTLSSATTVTANFTSTATVPISLVQTTTNCTVASTTIACNWASAQTAGDTVMCFGGWPDATTTVSSIADTKTNSYTQVPTISPKVGTGLTQVAYYSQGIVAAAAGANTTTMTLSAGVPAISASTLTSGANSAGASSESTASITPSANQLVLITVVGKLASGNGPGVISTITGNSLTWVKVTSKNYGATEGTGFSNEMEVWRAMGASPTAGAITITWATASPNPVSWTVSQISGTDQTGTNGSGAIGNVAEADSFGGSPYSVTMGTFGSSANGTYAVAEANGAFTFAAGTGMTALNNNTSALIMLDEWATGNVASPSVTYTGGASAFHAMMGIEIKVPQNRRDMRCLEYAGLSGGVDTSAAAVGTGTAVGSGAIGATTVAGDLITGAALSNQSVATAASGYTQRVKNSFGDDVEDEEGVAVSSTPNFQPTLGTSGNWVAMNISWKSGGAAQPTTATLTVVGGGTGGGTLTSNIGSPALSCTLSNGTRSGVCSTVIPLNSPVTITAVPDSNSVFAGYSGITGCSTAAICNIPSLTQNSTIQVTFNPNNVANFYVNHSTGNDANAGTQASPWKTLQHANDTATLGASGTIIHVADGTYTEVTSTGTCSSFGFPSVNLCVNKGGTSQSVRTTFLCDAGVPNPVGHCQLSGATNYGIMIVTNNVDIKGFDVGNTAAMSGGIQTVTTTNTAGAQAAQGNSVHVIGNYVHDLMSTAVGPEGTGCPQNGGIGIGNHHGIWQADAQIIGNIVERIGVFPSTTCFNTHGIYLNGTPAAQVYNNIVVGVPAVALMLTTTCDNRVSNNDFINAQTGIDLYGGDNNSGSCPNGPGFNTFDNNMVFATSTAKVVFGTVPSPSQQCTSTRPNLWANNVDDGVLPEFKTGPSGCDGVIRTWNSSTGASTFVTYNTNGTGANYQLKSTGAGANAGTTQCTAGGLSPCVPSVDILNVLRPQGTAYDIGAYESF